MSHWTARVCATVLSFVASAGCASTKQVERYRALRLEASRASSPAAAPAAQADPFAGAQALSRGELVALVIARNPGLDARRETWQAALARYPQETSLPDPTFGYGVRPRSFSSSEVDPAHDFELSQPLPFPGKLGLRGEISLSLADAAGEGVAAERVRLAALTSSLFDAYWLADRGIATNALHQASLETWHDAALARYAAGTGAQLDVFAAESELAMLLHTGIELGADRRIAVERLNSLLHRSPELALPPPPSALAPLDALGLDADALVEQALANRPELRARMAETRASEAAVELAQREFLPDFTLRGAYEGSWQETPLKPFIGLELNLPIQLGRRYAALDEAKALLARERSRSRALEDRVRFEVIAALERLRESQHLLELSRERIVPAARGRFESARAGFETGQLAFVELVDALRAVRDAELGELEVEARLSTRRAELARALGETAGMKEDER
ncbi:MAG: TolC family protein [Myxococcota bacterium]